MGERGTHGPGSGRGRKPMRPLPGTPGAAVMSRSSAGGPRIIGELDRLVGPFRCDPSLTEPGAITFEDARDRVFADLDRQVVAGNVKAKTVAGYKKDIRPFVTSMTTRYSDNPELRRATGADITLWLPKPRVGSSAPLAENSQRTRLYAVNALYITVNALGLFDQNPAAAVHLPRNYERYVHPFTDDQMDQLKDNAPYQVGETRRPAVLALTMLGATLAENAYTRVCDIDFRRRLVWFHDGDGAL